MNNNNGRLPPLHPTGLPPLHSQPINIPNSTSVTTSAGRGYGTTITRKNETTITTSNVGRGMMGQPSYPANSSNMLGRGSVQNNNLSPLPALPPLNPNQGRQPAPQQQRYNNPSSQNIAPYSDTPVILKKNQTPDERPIFEAKY